MSESEFVDRELICQECSQPFTFTAGEQSFFADKELTHDPRRCKPCRQAKKERVEKHLESSGHEVQVQCGRCGKDTTVPFVPVQGRPVYCYECYQIVKAER